MLTLAVYFNISGYFDLGWTVLNNKQEDLLHPVM